MSWKNYHKAMETIGILNFLNKNLKKKVPDRLSKKFPTSFELIDNYSNYNYKSKFFLKKINLIYILIKIYNQNYRNKIQNKQL